MVKILAQEIKVCSDCLDVIEFSDDDLGYTPGTLFAHMQKMLAEWPEAAQARFVYDGEETIDFSHSACQGCNSRLAGARHSYSLIG